MKPGEPESGESIDGVSCQRGYFVVAALVGFTMILVETARHGIGISPDSVGYIAQARRLADAGAAETLLIAPEFVTQPPLYPLLLGLLARITGTDPSIVVRYLNATLFAALIWVACGLLLRRTGRRLQTAVAAAAPIFILSARSLHEVFGMAWSEPPFVLLCVLFLVSIGRYLRDGEAASLYACVALAVAAVFVRYSGVTLIATGALVIPFADGRSRRARARDWFVFVGWTVACFGLWILRNHHLSGTLLGARDPALYSFAENAARSFAIAQAHLLPGGDEIGPPAKAVAVLAFAALAASVLLPRRTSVFVGLVRDRAIVIPCAVFVTIYCGFTLVTSSFVAYDPIDFRLLAPAFLPLWALVALTLDAAIRPEGKSGRARGIRMRAIALMILLAIQPLRQTVQDFTQWREQGRGLSRSKWAESPLLEFLRNGEGGGDNLPLFSDMRTAIVWYVGGSVKNAPMRTACTGRKGESLRRCFMDSVDPEFFDSYLIDFSEQRHPYYYSIEELNQFVALETVFETADGRVLRVSRRPEGDEAESGRVHDDGAAGLE